VVYLAYCLSGKLPKSIQITLGYFLYIDEDSKDDDDGDDDDENMLITETTTTKITRTATTTTTTAAATEVTLTMPTAHNYNNYDH
jgi:hypothetical protein